MLITVMNKILVLESSAERRAAMVDALCELPGVEVRAQAADVRSALRAFVAERADVIVAGSSNVTDVVELLAVVRECRLEDVVIHAPHAEHDASKLWLACGASHVVVGPLSELARTVGEVARERAAAPPASTTRIPVQTDDHGPAGVQLDQAALAMRMLAKAHDAYPPTEIVDLAELLRDAFAVYRRVIPDEVDVIVEAAGDTPPVRCVPKDMERLALRVVLAACEAMPWGGKVWLIVEPEGASRVRLEVLDTGSGVRLPTNDGVRVAASRRDPGVRARLQEIEALVHRQHGSLLVDRAGDGRQRLEIMLPAADAR
jgi:hypothetical protein